MSESLPDTVRKDFEAAIKEAMRTSDFAAPPNRKALEPFRPPVRNPASGRAIKSFGSFQPPKLSKSNVSLGTNMAALPSIRLRKRKVSREDIIKALILMEGGSLQKELESVGLDISASAFVQRRHQIEPALFDDVLTALNTTYSAPKTYLGWRVLAVDGTAVNIAYNRNSPCFVQHAGAPKGYCQLHATPLFDVLNRQYLNCVIQPQPEQDEIGAIDFMLEWYVQDLKEKVLIVADRGFSSYNLFATLEEKGISYLIRTKNSKGAMREVAKLPMEELDTEIQFTITTENTKETREKGYIWIQTRKDENRVYSEKTRAGRWSHPSPYPMKLRIVRIRLDSGELETLVTNVPPSILSPSQIKELYHARWGIETAFLELKYSLGLDNQHGKSYDFARQEVIASMIMANICSRIISGVSVKQGDGNKYEYAVNRKHAVRLIKQYLRTPGADGEQLLKNISKHVVAVRPGRKDARKLRPKSFKEFVYRVAA